MTIPKLVAFLTLLLLAGAIPAQKIVMKIKGLTPTEGEPVNALEFKGNAETSWEKGSGPSVAKPSPTSFLIEKDLALFTHEITKKILTGSFFEEITFGYFDQDNPKSPYYELTIVNVFATQVHFLSPECPTCLNLENQFGFVFKKITLDDKENKKTLIWDISTGTTE